MTQREEYDLVKRCLERIDDASARRLSPGRLVREVARYEDEREVREAIDAMNGARGWVQTTDRLLPWGAASQWPEGPVLCAELATSDKSARIRRVGNHWIVATLVRKDADSAHDYIETVRLHARDGFGALRYEVHWTEIDGELKATESRLVASEEE